MHKYQRRRTIFQEMLPGFKIEKIRQDGLNKIYKIECRKCFHNGPNWPAPSAVVAGGKAVQVWASEHEHELSLDQAIALWIAAPRNKTASKKLREYCRIAGWTKQASARVPVPVRYGDPASSAIARQSVVDAALALADAVAEAGA